MPQDWFSANAPKADTGADWFAANAPQQTAPPQQAKATFFNDPKAYLQQRAGELNNESMRQHLMALGPESEGRSFVNRAGHSLLSLVPETAAVIDKAAAGLMDWKNAAAVVSGLVDPAIPAAYFGTQGVADLTGLGGGESSAKKAVQNPTPENVQNALLSGAQVVGAGAIGNSPRAGTLVNPKPVISRALLLGKTPPEAYQSALKPSTTLGQAKTAAVVKAGLENKIPVSQKGLEKLGELIDEVSDQMDAAIPANSPLTVNKFAVASRLGSVADQFKMQVNPNADLKAVRKSGNEFLATQPNEIQVKDAAQIKSGTYKQIGDKAYGELGTAAKESQKALARGIKEELIVQFPELKDLGIRDQQLLNLQPVLERAVGRIGNHQLMGIGTPIATGAAKALTGSSKIAAVAGVVKAVLDNPIVKSRLAISLSKSGVPYQTAVQRVNAYQSALAAATLPAASGSGEYPDQSPDQ